MTDDDTARLRALAERAKDTARGSDWYGARLELSGQADAILALLDALDEARRERDDSRAKERRALREAFDAVRERDAAVAMLTEAGMYVNPHTANDVRTMALWKRIDAMLGGEG